MPITFQGQKLNPNKKFTFEALPVYGDQSEPMASSVKTASELGKALFICGCRHPQIRKLCS